MVIHQYSKEVLVFNEKLTLPGFGSIKIEKKPANLEGKRLYPSLSGLVFDPMDKLDDEILIKKICEAEDLSIEEARQRVLEFVDDIRFSLNKGEKYHIESLCILYQDNDNQVIIEKDAEFILDFENYGLESFELEDMDLNEESEPGKTDIIENVVIEDQLVSETYTHQKNEDDSFQLSDSPEQTDPEPDIPVIEQKNSRGILWMAAGLVIIILAAIFFVPLKTKIFDEHFSMDSFFSEDSMAVTKNNVSDNTTDSGFENTIDEWEKDLLTETSAEDALSIKNTEETVESAVNEDDVKYYIIAGSFRDFSNAEDLQKSLSFQGYPSLIIEPGNGSYRVSVISFTNKNQALVYLSEFREKSGMSEAWLMTLN